MLTLSTRDQFATLLDAETLRAADDRPALIYVSSDQPPITVSRRAFATTTATTATSLHELGLRPRDLVVIAHTQNLESIFAFWGALRLGAIPSMFPTLTEKLDPQVYMRGMAELARLSGVAAVLTTDDFAPTLRPQLPCPVYGSSELKRSDPQIKQITEENSWSRSLESAQSTESAEQIAFLQHSSGTTGLQKGVALTHAAVLNQLAAYSDTLALHEDDVVVSWLPLYHDMGLIAGFLLPLVQGLPLVLMSPFDWVQHPALLFRAIHDHRATLCWLPNFAYNHCARRIRQRDSDGVSAASMRLFINCSEPVRHDSHTLFLERFAANGVRPEMLGVSYAMAENTFAVTQTPPGRPARLDYVEPSTLASGYAKVAGVDDDRGDALQEGRRTAEAVLPRVSCGWPIPGTELRVLDANGRPLPDRAVGEIAIRSNCLLTGYYRRDDLHPFTAGGWFLTGDRGYVAEGELFVVGRAKDLIINAGKNIYPGDIEAIVNEVAGVHAGRAVVFGVPDEREGTELLAVVAETGVTDAAERQAIARTIRAAVAQQAAVTLSYVHLVGPRWLLKTSSGKLARAANRDKWLLEREKE
jgi:acyl-CoA synthetase (AMP-forming)/AMP-acid ligase II